MTKVSISGTGVKQVGSPSQFQVTVSLSTGSLQLEGHVMDASNNVTDPPLGTFVWKSEQRFVATVDSTGLVTLVGRGSCTLECRYSRAASLPWTYATPSPTEGMSVFATCDLTVTP